MGRHRKSDIPQEFQQEKNILPKTPKKQAQEIDYGYPIEIIQKAAFAGENKLTELYGFGKELQEKEIHFYNDEALETIKYYIAHPGATTRQFQSHFLAKKLKAGWRLGTLNIDELYHPNILPFEELPECERERLAIFKSEAFAVLEEYRNKIAIGE